MPKRKLTNPRPTMRKRRKVMRRKRLRRRIPRGPFPNSRIVKMKLCTPEINLSSLSGAIAYVDIYANWPYYGTRHAFGWDQWAALYNEAVVLGSKIKVYQYGYTEPATGAGLTENSMGGIYLSDDTTNYTDYQALIEANKGKFYRCRRKFGEIAKCTNTFSCKKFFNVKDVKDNFDRLGNLTSATAPGDSAIYKVWQQPTDKTSTIGVTLNCVIEYIVLFSQPKDVPNS